MADFYKIVDKTFSFEGGYQQFPNDTANYCDGQLIGTNHGISAIAYKAFYGKCPTVQQMKALTIDEAKKIYKKLFWDKISGDQLLNDSVAHIIFDSYIASGGTGLKRVKKAINSLSPIFPSIDSLPINAIQAKLINIIPQQQLFEEIKKGEIENRKDLANKNPEKYAMFLKGWLNRLGKIVYQNPTGTSATGLGIITIITLFFF